MFVSVVICTRDRCDKLRGALRSLAAVEVPTGSSLEVVVVDNGSSDATSETCVEFSSCLQVQCVRENRRGKSRALDRGIGTARGDVIAFTDDDCVVHASWLNALVEKFAADPELAGVGGRVELYNPEDRNFTTITHPHIVDLRATPVALFVPLIIGANMAFRADVLKAVGRFDARLGPGSRFGAVSEDMDYVYRAYRKKFKLVYFPGILVFHNHGRQSDAEIDRVSHQYRVGRGAFLTKHMRDEMVLKRFYWDVLPLVKTAANRFFSRQSSRAELRVLGAMFIGALSRVARA
jgi:glycosyltransferase involved in cell wall biosynthesis